MGEHHPRYSPLDYELGHIKVYPDIAKTLHSDSFHSSLPLRSGTMSRRTPFLLLSTIFLVTLR